MRGFALCKVCLKRYVMTLQTTSSGPLTCYMFCNIVLIWLYQSSHLAAILH